MLEKPDKKERSSKTKEKREKLSDEEKELRKERKLGRKRVKFYYEKNLYETLSNSAGSKRRSTPS